MPWRCYIPECNVREADCGPRPEAGSWLRQSTVLATVACPLLVFLCKMHAPQMTEEALKRVDDILREMPPAVKAHMETLADKTGLRKSLLACIFAYLAAIVLWATAAGSAYRAPAVWWPTVLAIVVGPLLVILCKAQAPEKMEKVLSRVDEVLHGLPSTVSEPVGKIAGKTGARKSEVACALAASITVAAWNSAPLSVRILIIELPTLVWPARRSCEALAAGSVRDISVWLTYWMSKAVVSFAAYFVLLALFGIDALFLALAAYVYLANPSFVGAEVVLDKFLKPHVFPAILPDAATGGGTKEE